MSKSILKWHAHHQSEAHNAPGHLNGVYPALHSNCSVVSTPKKMGIIPHPQ